MSGLYAYAVMRADEPAPIPGTGFGGARPRTLVVGSLAVAVTDVDGPPAVEAGALAIHDGVVRAIFETGRAVLPLRFGQVSADADALAAALEPRAADLVAALDRVDGCAQMTVRLFGAAGDESRREPPPAGPGAGARYLAARRRRLCPPELDGIRERLAPLVRAELLRPVDRPPLRAVLYHLVRIADVAAWKAELAADPAAAARGPFVASGPFAPWAFTPGNGA